MREKIQRVISADQRNRCQKNIREGEVDIGRREVGNMKSSGLFMTILDRGRAEEPNR